MLSATVTDTGQITLPQEIRDRLKLVSGSKISFITVCKSEIHWYEAQGIGKKEFKIKYILE
jgi:AbrB family looped-hinge helix DNA binding protein